MGLSFTANLADQRGVERQITLELERQLALTRQLIAAEGQLEGGARRRAGPGSRLLAPGAGEASVSGALPPTILASGRSESRVQRKFNKRFAKSVRNLVNKQTIRMSGAGATPKISFAPTTGVQALSSLSALTSGNVAFTSLAFPNLSATAAAGLQKAGLPRLAGIAAKAAVAATPVGMALMAEYAVLRMGFENIKMRAGNAVDESIKARQMLNRVFKDPLDPKNMRKTTEIETALLQSLDMGPQDSQFFKSRMAARRELTSERMQRLATATGTLMRGGYLAKEIIEDETGWRAASGTAFGIQEEIAATARAGGLNQEVLRRLEFSAQRLKSYQREQARMNEYLARNLQARAEARNREQLLRATEQRQMLALQDWNPN